MLDENIKKKKEYNAGFLAMCNKNRSLSYWRWGFQSIPSRNSMRKKWNISNDMDYRTNAVEHRIFLCTTLSTSCSENMDIKKTSKCTMALTAIERFWYSQRTKSFDGLFIEVFSPNAEI